MAPFSAAETDKNFTPPQSEDAILENLARHFGFSNPGVLLGRGDDCAILRAGRPLCVSSDLFLEDIHFRKSYFTPYETGHKALAVNVSDLAAFGAKPVAFTLCLGLPEWVDMDWLEPFFSGMAALAGSLDLALAGGDLSRCQSLHISITVFGESLEGCGFLGRGGAMPGDAIFLVGSIGLARAGLLELEAHGRKAMEQWPACCGAHLKPDPKIAAGLMLARAGFNSRPPALMDVSDGLLRDLPRLLGESGELGAQTKKLGAAIDLPASALHPELLKYAAAHGLDPALHAFTGGEDYALLGACAQDMLPSLKAAIPCFQRIGQVTNSGGIFLNGQSVAALKGFDHFESRKKASQKNIGLQQPAQD